MADIDSLYDGKAEGFSLDEDKKLLDLYASRVDMLNKKFFPCDESDLQLELLESHLGEFFSIEMLEELVKKYKEKLDKLIRYDIIEILDRLGLKKCTTASGISIEKDKAYNTKIIDKDAFFAWCEEQGYKDSIKDNFEFGKGTVDDALTEFLNERGYDYKRKQDIHYQTLKKLMKEHIEAHGELPASNVATVEVFDYAKVKK